MRVLLLLLALAGPAFAVQPDEILDDPAQEARAREISAELRCLVCRNESIDDSNADLAKTLRLLVRERIEAGDDNEQVKDYLVARYGEFVLLKPRFTLANALIWLAGPIIFLIGVAVIWRNARRRTAPDAAAPLTEAEQARLKRLLDES